MTNSLMSIGGITEEGAAVNLSWTGDLEGAFNAVGPLVDG